MASSRKNYGPQRCKWVDCGLEYPSLETVMQHIKAAHIPQSAQLVGDRKLIKLAPGVYKDVTPRLAQPHQEQHPSQTTGNTTNTTTTTDDTSILPPSFGSLPPPPSFFTQPNVHHISQEALPTDILFPGAITAEVDNEVDTSLYLRSPTPDDVDQNMGSPERPSKRARPDHSMPMQSSGQSEDEPLSYPPSSPFIPITQAFPPPSYPIVDQHVPLSQADQTPEQSTRETAESSVSYHSDPSQTSQQSQQPNSSSEQDKRSRTSSISHMPLEFGAALVPPHSPTREFPSRMGVGVGFGFGVGNSSNSTASGSAESTQSKRKVSDRGVGFQWGGN